MSAPKWKQSYSYGKFFFINQRQEKNNNNHDDRQRSRAAVSLVFKSQTLKKHPCRHCQNHYFRELSLNIIGKLAPNVDLSALKRQFRWKVSILQWTPFIWDLKNSDRSCRWQKVYLPPEYPEAFTFKQGALFGRQEHVSNSIHLYSSNMDYVSSDPGLFSPSGYL